MCCARPAGPTRLSRRSGGTNEQIKYLVSQGAIKPLCDLLSCSDARIVTVALEGLENILKVGVRVGGVGRFVGGKPRRGVMRRWQRHRGGRLSSCRLPVRSGCARRIATVFLARCIRALLRQAGACPRAVAGGTHLLLRTQRAVAA